VVIKADGELVLEDRPSPTPADDEVRVRVHGAGLNRADLLQRAGAYPAPLDAPPDIPGLEFAGEVTALGRAAEGLAEGDRVFGIVSGGAQAEELVVRASHCARVPDGLDLVAAGGVPEVFVTAHDALRTQAGLMPDEVVLIHAVGSGVGTAGVQLAEALACAVIGTDRKHDKLDRAMELGLDHGVLAPTPLDAADLASRIIEAAGPVDVILDLVGGDYVGVDVAVAAPKGRVMLVGAVAGGRAQLDILSVMGKRLTVTGTVLRARSAAEKAAAMWAFGHEVVPLLAAGTVRPIVDQILPLPEVGTAYERLASDRSFGKVILDAV
jgi:putative PIG3 family NAD(P)H quinone oxidoreductase